jgi:hypothetical protein
MQKLCSAGDNNPTACLHFALKQLLAEQLFHYYLVIAVGSKSSYLRKLPALPP